MTCATCLGGHWEQLAYPGKIIDYDSGLSHFVKSKAAQAELAVMSPQQYKQFQYQQQQLAVMQKDALEQTFGISLHQLLSSDPLTTATKPPEPQKPIEPIKYKSLGFSTITLKDVQQQLTAMQSVKNVVTSVSKHKREPVEPVKPKPALVPTFSGRKFRDI